MLRKHCDKRVQNISSKLFLKDQSSRFKLPKLWKNFLQNAKSTGHPTISIDTTLRSPNRARSLRLLDAGLLKEISTHYNTLTCVATIETLNINSMQLGNFKIVITNLYCRSNFFLGMTRGRGEKHYAGRRKKNANMG
jgi:hypothetical protein